MSERRVAHIVGKAGGRDDGTYFREIDAPVRIFLHQAFGDIIA
jgi:hypothetical protein